ncbi:MAG: DNA-protecting protein DprA [bacterium]|nr:DNA-protecting protein DprA [bacterium]
MMVLNDKIYTIALSVISSPSTNKLWEYLPLYSPQEIYERISFEKKPVTQEFISGKYSTDPIESAKQILEVSESKSIEISGYWDADYPLLLKEIAKPPLALYRKGNLEYLRPISIVGTRKAEKRSLAVTRRIATDLSFAGYTVVSGMAIGIDRESHMAALDGMGGTIGVLANGIDIVYPSVNKDLYYLIEESPNSALVSEYPPGILAGKWTFVRRNRIISGLSLGTVVIKAGEKSGAMITARYALEQNREVFACPGYSFDDEYKGCFSLIQSGATLVSTSSDILRELPGFGTMTIGKNIPKKESEDFFQNSLFKDDENDKDSIEGNILNFLSSGENDVDAIIRTFKYPPGDVQEAVMLLEFSGKIFRSGNLLVKVSV